MGFPEALELRPQNPPIARTLLNLPAELQLQILHCLDFADMVRLRRTCRYYRGLISKEVVRTLLSLSLHHTLLSHCYICLHYDESRLGLFWADWTDPRYPLSSKCVNCAVQRGDLFVGCKYSLGNFTSVWVCRWCGYPVLLSPGRVQRTPEFHNHCYTHYNSVLLLYTLFGLIQMTVAFSGCVLAWHLYPHDRLIMPLATTFFISAFLSFVLVCLRGRSCRTYHLSLVLELATLGTAAGILYSLSFYVAAGHYVIGMMVFFGISIICRLLNSIGYALLVCEYKLWRQNRPIVHPAKRILNFTIAAIIFWTYPQAIMQVYPGKHGT